MNLCKPFAVAVGLSACLSALAVGEWTMYQHFPTEYRQVKAFNNRIVVQSGNNFFFYDPETGDTLAMSRLTGLSDANIATLEVCPEAGVLCLAYADGNIDLIDSTWACRNVPDYKNKVLAADKTVNSVLAVGDALYVSTANGFFVVDARQGIIPKSYQFADPTLWSFAYGQWIYRATGSGLYRCEDNGAKPYAADNWERVSTEVITDVSVFTKAGAPAAWMTSASKQLLQVDSDGLVSKVAEANNYDGIAHSSHYIYVHGSGTRVYDTETGVWAYNWSAPYSSAFDMAVADDDSTFYFIAPHQGLLAARMTEFAAGSLGLDLLWQDLAPEEVGFGYLRRLQVAGGRLYGINWEAGHQDHTAGGVSWMDLTEGTWHNLYEDNVRRQVVDRAATLDPLSASAETQAYRQSAAQFRALRSFCADPTHPTHFWVGSMRNGLYHFEDDSLVARYDHTNSPLTSFSDAYICDWVDALHVDADGYVWLTNSGADKVLKCLTPTGQWLEFPISGFEGTMRFVKILPAQHDRYHLKWLLSGGLYEDGKVALYYDGGTPEDLSDDESRWFATLTDQDGNNYTPTLLNDVAEDHDGVIWLLTSAGPFVIDSQIEAFRNPGRVRRPKIPRNDGTNLADYLMANVSTTCIAVDAANRKWIGTETNGIYLLSPDGLTQLKHFTTDNSPLADNNILGIAIDDAEGTLYISTEEGVYAYATDAVSGAESYSAAYCYPNPIRPDYTGSLYVRGLKDQTQVRICDATGHVIFRTVSQGGMVSWDLRGPDGKRVPTGVYLVYGIDSAGKDGCVTKFLVVD